MRLRRRSSGPDLPITDFIKKSASRHRLGGSQSLGTFLPGARTFQQSVLVSLAIALTVTGVVAAVAITVRGNSSTTDNVISLGVGQAQANSCNATTAVKTDTISQWDDPRGDFTLQRVDVTGVQSSCANNALTLVINMTSGTDLNVTCTLPASTSLAYTQGTFVFASTSFTSSGSAYGCPAFGSTNALYMASISAAAVQIK